MTTRRLLLLALCSLLTLGGTDARAQQPPDDPVSTPWGSILVPGGFSALQHAAQINGPAEDWRTVPVLIELSFSGLEGLRFTRNIESYAALLRRLYRHATDVSPDRTVGLALRDRRRAAFDQLMETLGLELDRRSGQVRLRAGREDKATIEALARAGLPMGDLVARLNSGASVSLATADAVAPLPLGTDFWQSRFEPEPPPHDLLWAILANREMSSLYYGLLGFDDDTLRAVQSDAALSKALIRHALVLPTVAPALRVRSGRIVAAGGPAAAPLWEDLVGKRLDRPGEFVNALLAADGGRLAHFYSTVGALPASTAAWVVGGPSATPGARRDMFRRLYAGFESSLEAWRADGLVEPPPGGPAEVLFTVAARPDGTLVGPPWRDFWRRALESDAWPADPAREVVPLSPGDLLDAAGLLDAVCPGRCDPARLESLALVQREFPEAELPMAPALLTVVRARLRYPSLALEIERMQLADPAVYSLLGRMASRIEHVDQPAQVVALVQFQSALALLVRLRAVGAPSSMIRQHAAALGELVLNGDGFDGGIIRWLTRLFPVKDGEDLEMAVTRSLSGAGWQPEGEKLVWEGLSYRVDIVSTERARIRAVLEKFTANSLAGASTFMRLADELSAADVSGRSDAVIAEVAAAVAAARDVGPVSWTGAPAAFARFRNLSREVESALQKGRPADRRKLDRAMRSMRTAADIVAADALAALVYALALQDPNNSLAMSPEFPRRHHLQPTGPAGNRSSPWALPRVRYPDGGIRYIAGSLLALDAGVPELGERRMGGERPQQEPNMATMLAAGLQRTAALTTPWSIDASDIAGIDAARSRGAAIVDTLHRTSTLDRSLLDAGIAGPRAGWLRWLLARGEPAGAVLALEHFVRLGGWTPASPRSWGASDAPSMCLCLTMPRISWETRGQPRRPEAAAVRIIEPALRVAIELHRRGLPASLAPGVLALLMTDLIANSSLPHPADVPALVYGVSRIPPERFDDYIAAVAARGPLVRIEGEGKPER